MEGSDVGGRPCHHGVVLLSVCCHDGGEVGLFFHETIIGMGWGGFGAMVDTCPTGQAAAGLVLISHHILRECIHQQTHHHTSLYQ